MRATPLHRSLLEIKSTAGSEFILTVINFALCAVMFLGPKLVWWIVIAYFGQKILQWMFRRDPQLSLVLSRYIKEADAYDPWPRFSVLNKRPLGLGRDLPLC